MCSIIGSFSKEKFKELVDLNQFRGNFSYSLSILDTISSEIKFHQKEFGKFDFEALDNYKLETSDYIIGHVQAPTGGMIKDYNRIHPTVINSSRLWHNGIITPRGIKYMQNYNSQGLTDTFDTKLLHNHLYNTCDTDFSELSEIEGLFSCLYFTEKSELLMFRTRHGKLYIDEDLSISSERFEDSKCINYDTIYKINFQYKNLDVWDTFSTLRFNIVVPGELEDF